MFAINTTTTSRRVSSNPKRTEKPCALGFSVRFGLKHTLRCVIWVKSWKLEALIWAGSGVIYNISLRPGAESASEGEQPGLVDCTLYFVIRIGLFANRVRLFSARVGLFFSLEEDFFWLEEDFL